MSLISSSARGLHALHRGDVSVVVDLGTPIPTVLHWGARIDDADLVTLGAALERPVPHGTLDVVVPLSLLPEHASGYFGRPGIEGSRRDGSRWSPRCSPLEAVVTADSIRTVSVDEVAELRVECELVLRESGALRVRATLTNLGEVPYGVGALRPTLPLPAIARESLSFSGRWTNEFQPVRLPLRTGSFAVENRSGRTSHDRIPLLFAGSSGFDEATGEVWGFHLEWSGNSVIAIDVSTDGRTSVQPAELLLHDEIVLAPGASYATPWLCAVYSSHGLVGASQVFHDELRARPSHPSTPRPVTLNIWEAVYFDHQHQTIAALADRAASVGVERFVIDDGWFSGRRHDRAGLGDWWVDPAVWPDGLGAIADHVRSLGMQFGLWFEPEMVNPDSDLFRKHPEWVLTDQAYPDPVLGRTQLVLDVANDDVRAYLFDRISSLLTDYPIEYIKWDNNREYVQATHLGRAGVHAQTLGSYRLLDDLRAKHPGVEIESCASGGGRIDFAILERTARFWTSDNNDPLDRQRIQRGASYLFPPEYMGAHIAAPRSYTSRRVHTLGFRGGTAMFGHLGIEWNLLDASESDLAELRLVVQAHQRFRPLLHSGDVVRVDHPNPSILVHGVSSRDRSEALFAIVQVATAPSLVVEPVRIPGLDPGARYQVERVPLPGELRGLAKRQPGWVSDGVVLSGRALASVGLQPPVLDPESLLVVHLTRIS